MSTVTITKDFTGYLAKPAQVSKAPVVLVAQEIFGVNKPMREICDKLAAAGYIAFCPDLFWRMQPGVQLDDRQPQDWQQAMDYFSRFDVDQGIEDLKTALDFIRALPESTGKAGVVGFCLGGKLAYLMAARSTADCAVSFYGVGLEDLIDEGTKIKTPLLMHMAEKDRFVSPAARDQIVAGLQSNTAITIHVYPNVDHAFARPGGEHYDPQAASLAHERTAEFFTKYLS